MKNNLTANIVTMTLFAVLAIFPTIARGQCTRCCGLCSPPCDRPNLTVSPSTAEEGQPVVLMTVVHNCASEGKVATVKVNVTPSAACASFAEAFAIQAYVPAFESRTVTYTFSAPKCEGAYRVAETSSNAAGSATATLTVGPARVLPHWPR
jgi:hypothetical protein